MVYVSYFFIFFYVFDFVFFFLDFFFFDSLISFFLLLEFSVF